MIAGLQANSQSGLADSTFVPPGLCEHPIAHAAEHDAEQLLEECGFGPTFMLRERAKP